MGLDMYLTKKIYIGAEFGHRKIKAIIQIEADGKLIKIDSSKVSEIIESACYWRSASQVHAWFVRTVQRGIDDCGSYIVMIEQLHNLKNLCERVLEKKELADELLPMMKGFFYGGTECYFDQLKETIEMIEKLSLDADYSYRASWQ